MGELIELKVEQAKTFTEIRDMLNTWWREQEKKPMANTVKIRHIVEMAVNRGWTLDECYQALNLTWAFTESAFETALRRTAEENEESEKRVTNIASVKETKKALELDKKESLSIQENVKRLHELKKSLKSKG